MRCYSLLVLAALSTLAIWMISISGIVSAADCTPAGCTLGINQETGAYECVALGCLESECVEHVIQTFGIHTKHCECTGTTLGACYGKLDYNLPPYPKFLCVKHTCLQSCGAKTVRYNGSDYAVCCC